MDEQGKARQENRQQGSQTEDPSRGQRSQGSGYISPFSVTPGEFFTMSPITLMRRFTEDIDRAFGLTGNRGAAGSTGQSQGQQLDWVPRVEVNQSGNNLVVHAELPGLSEKDIHVETTDQGLLITGEKNRKQENEKGGWHHSEFSYGRFSRLIPLPENANAEQARANFQNGVLEVSIPMPEAENKRRQIPVQGSGTAQSPEQSSTPATTKSATAGR